MRIIYIGHFIVIINNIVLIIIVVIVIIIIFPRNVSFREYYVFISNAAAASQFCQRDNFEGLKLRSSNLTHALLIQISRTSSIIDIVIPSKMAAGGHFVKNFKDKKSCVSI